MYINTKKPKELYIQIYFIFSVHYWYWNNKDNPDKKEGAKLSDFWTEDKLTQLASIGEKVNNIMLHPG